MLGVIIGDIAGSRFEWHNIKSKEFELLHELCRCTDDSVMSLAVAKAILDSEDNYDNLSQKATEYMRKFGRLYPNSGYGGFFRQWLYSEDPQPYHSYGNGAAMRVSACGFAARNLNEAKRLAEKVTRVSHNHIEGMKGAEATAVAIYLSRFEKNKELLKNYIERHYYPMDFTLDDIRDTYEFDGSCQGSVPQALMAFFESDGFEDAIRNAVSIGGDSDTIAAITGSIAEAYYGIPEELKKQVRAFLDEDQLKIISDFENKFA